jgi:hypothetical protein
MKPDVPRERAPGQVVKNLNRHDCKTAHRRSQVIKRRAIGPEWISVVARRRAYTVAARRIHATPLAGRP